MGNSKEDGDGFCVGRIVSMGGSGQKRGRMEGGELADLLGGVSW